MIHKSRVSEIRYLEAPHRDRTKGSLGKGSFTGEISRISKISKFSRISGKWPGSLFPNIFRDFGVTEYFQWKIHSGCSDHVWQNFHPRGTETKRKPSVLRSKRENSSQGQWFTDTALQFSLNRHHQGSRGRAELASDNYISLRTHSLTNTTLTFEFPEPWELKDIPRNARIIPKFVLFFGEFRRIRKLFQRVSSFVCSGAFPSFVDFLCFG